MCNACRLTGSAALRFELLARYGAVVLIPPCMAQAEFHELAAYLNPRLKAAAGGELIAYRRVDPYR